MNPHPETLYLHVALRCEMDSFQRTRSQDKSVAALRRINSAAALCGASSHVDLRPLDVVVANSHLGTRHGTDACLTRRVEANLEGLGFFLEKVIT